MNKSFAIRGAVVACSTATAVLIVSVGFVKYSAKTAWAETPAVPPAALAATLGRLSLDPRSLTAIGVEASSIASIVAAGREALSSRLAAIEAADQSVRESLARVERLERLAVAGVASEGELSGLSAARNQLASARSTLAGLLNEVSETTEVALAGSHRSTLAVLRRPASANLAMQHRVAGLDSGEQAALRDAIAHVLGALASGRGPDAGARQRVLDAEARSEVAAAASYLSERLQANTTAWRRAVGV